MMLAMARIYSYQITCDISVLPGHSSKLESDCSRVRTHSSKTRVMMISGLKSIKLDPKYYLWLSVEQTERLCPTITSCMARCLYGSSSTKQDHLYIPGQIKFACFIRVGNLALHRVDGTQYCTAAHCYIPTSIHYDESTGDHTNLSHEGFILLQYHLWDLTDKAVEREK